MQPYEVTYQTVGSGRERNVVGLMCPTALSQFLAAAGVVSAHPPIEVLMGDATVKWDSPSSPGYDALYTLGWAA